VNRRTSRLVLVSSLLFIVFALTVAAQEPTHRLNHAGFVVSMDMSADGSRVATACADSNVYLWEPATGNRLAAIAQNYKPTVVRFGPGSEYLAIGNEAGYVELWLASTGKHYATFRHHDPITDVAFSPDGSLVATSSRDNSSAIWNVKDKAHVLNMPQKNDVMAIQFSPDGTLIATASKDATVRLWNAKTGRLRTTMGHSSDVWTVAFSPDGSRLVSGSADNTARIWDVATGRLLHLLNHKDDVTTARFSPSGFLVATGSNDGMGRLWDVQSGEIMRTFQYAEAVTSVTFSPDGLMIANATRDDRAFIWDVSGEELLATLPHGGDVTSILFSADGLMVATASEDKTAALWSLTPPAIAPTLKAPGIDVTLDASATRGMALEWNPTPGAWTYYVQVSREPNFFSLIVDPYVGSTEYRMPSGKLGNGTYYWRVASSTVRDYLGPWSEMRSFTVDASNVVFADVVYADTASAIVEVRAERMTGLFGYQAALAFDPSVLQVESVEEGGFLKQAGAATNWQPPVIDNRVGRVTLLQYRLSGGGVDGAGTLARVRFKITKEGSTVVGFARLKLSDNTGSAIAGVSVESTVSATGPAQLTIVVTPRVIDNQLEVVVAVTDASNIENYELKVPYSLNHLELLSGVPNIRGTGTPTAGAVMTLRFRIWEGGDLIFRPSGVVRSPKGEKGRLQVAEGQIHVVASPPVDVNKDYRVDAADLVILGRNFDTEVVGSVRPNPDVNRDGIVDLFDFVAVAVAFGETYSAVAASPPVVAASNARGSRVGARDAQRLRAILGRLDQLGDGSAEVSRARRVLVRLLGEGMVTGRTTLLAAYPSPANPETWIPFELDSPSDVDIVVFNALGNVVRRLELGWRKAGSHISRDGAAYWDGANDAGEPVSSGAYWVQLRTATGDDTRRVLLVK